MSTAPSPLIQGLLSLSATDLLDLLLRFELAEPLLRQLKERELTGTLASCWPNCETPDPSPSADRAMAHYRQLHQLKKEEELQQWCARHRLAPQALAMEADHSERRDDLRTGLIRGQEESLFLRYKDRLDRVLYGLIRVDDAPLAQDLFYAIDAGELRFGEAARLHSKGPEARTQGIVGPVDLGTPHPAISGRLRTAQPGELLAPFQIEQWHIILQLHYRFAAEFDDESKVFLQELTLRSLVSESVTPELEQLLTALAEVHEQSGPSAGR